MVAVNAAVSPSVAAQLRELAAQLDAASARARAAADAAAGSSWWQELTGTDTTADALESVARAQENLTATIKARIERLTDDAGALALLREAVQRRWADVGDVEALARSLTVTGAAREVAADTASDLGDLAQKVGVFGVPALIVAAVALVVWKVSR